MLTSDFQQIAAMRAGVDYSFVIHLRKFSLRVRPLSMMETVKVTQAVTQLLEAMPASARNRIQEHTLIAKETLKMASTSDVGANDPKITDLIMDYMTSDEVANLFEAYVANVDRVNPSLETMTPGELADMIATLKKNGTTQAELASQLTKLSQSQLVSLASSLLLNGE